MRDSFRGYYRPTEDEFSALWTDCLFVLDANVMLALYQLGVEACEKLEEILAQIADRDRLWVPHQAALEYQRKRRGVIEDEARRYKSAVQSLERTRAELKQLRQQGGRLLGEIDALLETVEDASHDLGQKAEDARRRCLGLLEADDIRDKLDDLLHGRVGPEYGPERLAEVYQEAKARYEDGTPPGYRDEGKGGVRQYGDVIVWFQILDHAKEQSKPIIFVTNEAKKDWWWKDKSEKIVGPRPELIQEMEAKAGVSFYMYRIDPFMEHAGRHFELEVSQEVIEEAQDLGLREREETERELWERLGVYPGSPLLGAAQSNEDYAAAYRRLAMTGHLVASYLPTAEQLQRMAEDRRYLEEVYGTPPGSAWQAPRGLAGPYGYLGSPGFADPLRRLRRLIEIADEGSEDHPAPPGEEMPQDSEPGESPDGEPTETAPKGGGEE